MNPAFERILGYDVLESRGKSLSVFMDEDNAELLRSAACAGKDHLSFETAVICSDRSVKWLDWNVVVKNSKWFVNARDITEIKRLNAVLQKNLVQLQAAHDELESFSYSVSHDLRAPLRALQGNARILEEDFVDQLDADARKYLQRIHDNAVRMDHLINDLLAFSKIGKKEVRRSPIDMEAMVREVLSEASPSESHAAEVQIGKLPDADGDFSMLKQVWANLISNAIKYSAKKKNPKIEIGSTVQDGEVEYFIRDNGAGFDMAYSNKLFQTFQRLHDATEFEGMGIGLAIVYRIVLKHGGTIRAEAAPEKGACFYFRLPTSESSGVSLQP
jgi:light-regulated signal transduction histidine kinase (bacteriophytochrome)